MHTIFKRFITCGVVGTATGILVIKTASAVNRSAEDSDWDTNAYYQSINSFDE